MAQRRIPNKNKSALKMTWGGRGGELGSFFFIPLTALMTRTKARCQSCQRLYPEALSRSESRQRESHLFPLHMRYRHREYPLRVCCCERHNSTTKPEGIQPSLKAAAHSLPRPANRICKLLVFLFVSASDLTWPSPEVAPSPSCRPPGRGWVMELVRYLSLAKLFQSLHSQIVFTFLFLTLGCKIFV